MSEKRRDNKGRILRTGESQRKDLLYQYRYTNSFGKRITVYAPTLNELRAKEDDIQKANYAKLDYSKGEISLEELIKQYLSVKKNVRPQTMQTYLYFSTIIYKYPISSQKINTIKTLQAKQWILELTKDGIASNTVKHLRSLVKSAFQMACEEDVVSKNPFDFKLDMVSENAEKREALTIKQQLELKHFFQTQPYYTHLYDTFIVLLGTGLRVSELCGLTISDLDFRNQKIHVNKQLLRNKHGQRFVSPPKTKNGIREIPMLPEVEESLRSILAQRNVIGQDPVVDGYSGFLFLNKNGDVKTDDNIESSFRFAERKFNEVCNPEEPLRLTPHILRHTFCTNLVAKNINIKSLQYLMGHSSVKLTLDLYSHTSYKQAEHAMQNIVIGE